MSQGLLNDGVYYGISRERYDAIDRVNFSSLKFMHRSPKHYRANRLLKKSKPTDEVLIGNALHINVFEPETFERRVIRWDGGTRRGEEWDSFAEEYSDRVILTVAGWDACHRMADAVRSDDAAKKYLEGGAGEMTLLFTAYTSEGEPIAMKMRLDFDCDLSLVDLKSSSRYQPDPFGVQADNLHYDAQSALYKFGYKAATDADKPYRLVVVESAEPHDVVVYPVTETSLRIGTEKYQGWLDQLAWCRKSGRWPGLAGGAEIELRVPRWRMAEEDIESMDLQIEG